MADPPADVIFTDATIITMDDACPRAQALAVRDGAIVAVGAADEIASWRAGGTDVRSLRGATVLPGLHDIHAHHAVAGRAALTELAIPPGASVDDIVDAVAARAAALDDESWIVGGNWDTRVRAELEHPDALRRLDAAARGHPVLLRDVSQHNRWASSEALRRAGLDARAPDPDGGVIGRRGDGRLSGVLVETAGLLVERAREGGTAEADDDAASLHGVAALNGFGITAFQDAGVGLPVLRALHRLDRRGRLTAWVVTSVLANDPIFGTDPVGAALMAAAVPLRSEHVRPDYVKVFLDGIPGTRTGAFLEPYHSEDDEHDEHVTGETLLAVDELAALLTAAARHGMAAKIHCTGDAAVRTALDAIELIDPGTRPPVPYQIAHGQFVHPSDLTRFAALGVVADASPPLWFPGPITQAVSRLHPAAGRRQQPARSLVDLGAGFAAGSDWPVSRSPDPWTGMQGLVTRKDPTGRFPGSVSPEEALRPAEALAAYTSWSAAAMGLGGLTGVLIPGAAADLVVVDRDPTSVDPETIAGTRVHETWFAGRIVHETA